MASLIEFKDILLGSTLPLHPYLIDHPRLSIRLISDGNFCGETLPVDGDLATGIWEINSTLSANSLKQSATLAIVASKGGLSIRFASVKLSVAELLTQIEARPDGYQEFKIRDSSSIQHVMTYLVNVLPSLGMNNPSSHVSTHDVQADPTVDNCRKNTQPPHEPDSPELPSREDLELVYANIGRMPDQDQKADMLSLLGAVYYDYYQKIRAKADLEKAISMHEEAMWFTGSFHPQLAENAHRLAVALAERFEQGGYLIDVERAISHYQTAVEATDDLEKDKPGRLSNLGNALELRFERLGDLSDLESAITFKRKGVKLAPDDHPYSPALFNNLGAALQARFNHLGSLTDLEDAISNKRKAVELTPDGHPDKPGRFNNLWNVLQIRFEHLGSLTDLEDAILSMRKAVELTPNGHPDKPGRFNNLGKAL